MHINFIYHLYNDEMVQCGCWMCRYKRTKFFSYALVSLHFARYIYIYITFISSLQILQYFDFKKMFCHCKPYSISVFLWLLVFSKSKNLSFWQDSFQSIYYCLFNDLFWMFGLDEGRHSVCPIQGRMIVFRNAGTGRIRIRLGCPSNCLP